MHNQNQSVSKLNSSELSLVLPNNSVDTSYMQQMSEYVDKYELSEGRTKSLKHNLSSQHGAN